MAWGRAVKARGRARSGDRRGDRVRPVLFLFLDDRLPDPVGSVLRLCRVPGAAALFGVVVRARDPDQLAALAHAVAPLCRAARVLLLVSGDAATGRRVRAGLHLPEALVARWPRLVGLRGPRRLMSRWTLAASAHDARGVRRAGRLGVDFLFVSPVFPTASHPGAPALGPGRAARLARLAPGVGAVLALGGIGGATARRLPPPFSIDGAAAVGALG